jgi:type IV secretory pathway TrbD component
MQNIDRAPQSIIAFAPDRETITITGITHIIIVLTRLVWFNGLFFWRSAKETTRAER